ncbi:pilin [Rhodanobacter hydrolyticus]|uniref:Pilin n=1 Tax=Rhodanobacter hydrolyticus TaxID=2250595 RepID=A0ABW8J9N2_9GAMM
MKNLQKGFTLIELMIVVAIIAILAAIAIPAYQNYLIRSQVSEGAVLADGVKTPMAEFYANKGYWPTTPQSAGLPSNVASISGKYVTQVSVATSGKIIAEFGGQANSAINGAFFALSAIPNGGSISWSCNNAATTVNAKYLPSSCNNGG